MTEAIQKRLSDLGIHLPPVPQPAGSYVPFTIAGKLLFLSGQGPRSNAGEWARGCVGESVSTQEAYQHARLTGIRLLAVMQAALGTLDRVERIVKVLGFVHAGPQFRDHPAVINGCSDLLLEVFGERGQHARSAIGVSGLPEGITVEIEAVVQFR